MLRALPLATLCRGTPLCSQVVCKRCGTESKNHHGHLIHCGKNKARCQGGPSIPLAEWQQERREEKSSKALSKLKDDAFVDNEASIINGAFQDFVYQKMTPRTTTNAFESVLKAHDERCMAEVVWRLGEGKNAAECASLQQ